jgi:hypothetical protein
MDELSLKIVKIARREEEGRRIPLYLLENFVELSDADTSKGKSEGG